MPNSDQKPFQDPEKAREAGLKSAAAREKPAEERAHAQIQRRLTKLTAALLDAALGEGDFVDLKPTDRLKALSRALEYGLGRPGASKETTPEPELPSSATLFGGDPE